MNSDINNYVKHNLCTQNNIFAVCLDALINIQDMYLYPKIIFDYTQNSDTINRNAKENIEHICYKYPCMYRYLYSLNIIDINHEKASEIDLLSVYNNHLVHIGFESVIVHNLENNSRYINYEKLFELYISNKTMEPNVIRYFYNKKVNIDKYRDIVLNKMIYDKTDKLIEYLNISNISDEQMQYIVDNKLNINEKMDIYNINFATLLKNLLIADINMKIYTKFYKYGQKETHIIYNTIKHKQPIHYANIVHIYVHNVDHENTFDTLYYAIMHCKYLENNELSEELYNAYEMNDIRYILNNKHTPNYTCIIRACKLKINYTHNHAFVYLKFLIDNYVPCININTTPRVYVEIKHLNGVTKKYRDTQRICVVDTIYIYDDYIDAHHIDTIGELKNYLFDNKYIIKHTIPFSFYTDMCDYNCYVYVDELFDKILDKCIKMNVVMIV